MKIFGSQRRETLKEAGYTFVRFMRGRKEAIVMAEDGRKELWFLHDDHAGYTLEIQGRGYEFGREWRETE